MDISSEHPFYSTPIQLLVKSELMNNDTIWEELALARNYAADGQPGRARILARRAVGKACQPLLKSHGCWHSGNSVLDSISELRRSSFIKPAWEPLFSHFLLHVKEDHKLPGEVDLVYEAAVLIPEITKMTLMRSSNNGED